MWDVVVVSLLVSFFWGVSPVVTKGVLAHIDHRVVMMVIALIYAVCMVGMAAMNWDLLKRDAKKLGLKEVSLLAGVAVLSGFVANYLYLRTLSKAPSHLVSALVFTSPVFTLILARLFLKEKIAWNAMVGVGLIVTGIILISFPPGKK